MQFRSKTHTNIWRHLVSAFIYKQFESFNLKLSSRKYQFSNYSIDQLFTMDPNIAKQKNRISSKSNENKYFRHLKIFVPLEMNK